MDEPPRVGHTHSLAIRGRPHIVLLHVRDSDFDRSIITGDLAVMTFIRVVLVIAAIMTLPASVLAQDRPPAQPDTVGRRPGSGGSGPSSAAAEPSGEIKAVTQAILEEIDKRLGADGQHRVPLRHDRAAADRLAELDQGQPVDAGQVPAVRAVERPPRVVDDRAGLDAGRCQGPRGRAGRAADPAGVGRLEPLDQGPRARAGGPRQGPVGRRAEPLQRQAQRGLGPPLRGLGPAFPQAAQDQPGRRDAAADARVHADAAVPPGAQEVPDRRGGRRDPASTRTRSTAWST